MSARFSWRSPRRPAPWRKAAPGLAPGQRIARLGRVGDEEFFRQRLQRPDVLLNAEARIGKQLARNGIQAACRQLVAVFGCSQYLLQGAAVLQGATSVLRGRLNLLGQPAQMRIDGRGAGVAQQARSNAFGVIRTRGRRIARRCSRYGS